MGDKGDQPADHEHGGNKGDDEADAKKRDVADAEQITHIKQLNQSGPQQRRDRQETGKVGGRGAG